MKLDRDELPDEDFRSVKWVWHRGKKLPVPKGIVMHKDAVPKSQQEKAKRADELIKTYRNQNGTDKLTPAQSRRVVKKIRKEFDGFRPRYITGSEYRDIVMVSDTDG